MKHKTVPMRHACLKRLRILYIALALILASGSALGASVSSVSPTTGLPTENSYRPILVNISNAEEARPAWGLSEADIVYEVIIWGPNHTRYLALFNDRHPAVAGAIRGARVYQFEWREEWDCPFIFGGGQGSDGTSIYTFIREHRVDESLLFDGIKPRSYTKIFSQNPDRVPPHNRVADLAFAAENFWPVDSISGEAFAPRLPNWRFSHTPTQGDETAWRVEIKYKGEENAEYCAAYTFNEKERVYERWYNGMEEYDYGNGKRIIASNVIVQTCELTYCDDDASRPVLTTTGGGLIDAFIDGQHIRGSWSRPTMDSQTEYLDENGDPLILLPGKTFIQVVPPEQEIVFVDADGVTWETGA